MARQARPWLAYWRSDIGRDGFYPFDLMAVLFVAEPGRFACAGVRADLRHDRTVFFPFNRMPALLVEPLPSGQGRRPDILYCHGLAGGSRHSPAPLSFSDPVNRSQ